MGNFGNFLVFLYYERVLSKVSTYTCSPYLQLFCLVWKDGSQKGLINQTEAFSF